VTGMSNGELQTVIAKKEMGSPQQPLTKILPKHLEIARRLCLGIKHRDIARDMGINESRLSQIIQSPLFQLELRRMQKRREEQIFELQNKIFEGALKGADLHNATIDNDEIPLPSRQSSATAMVSIAARIMKPARSLEGGEEGGYESRLREITTIREEIRTPIVAKEEEPLSLESPFMEGEVEEEDIPEDEQEPDVIEDEPGEDNEPVKD